MRDPARILALIEDKLEALLLDDESITARAVIRRMDGVSKHPSDITRNVDRRRLPAQISLPPGKRKDYRGSKYVQTPNDVLAQYRGKFRHFF